MRIAIIAFGFFGAVAFPAHAQDEAKRILAELKETKATAAGLENEMVKAVNAKDYATGCEKSKDLDATLARFRELSNQQRDLYYEHSNIVQRAMMDNIAASNKDDAEALLRVSKQVCDRAAQ